MRQSIHRKRKGFRLHVNGRHAAILEDPALDRMLAGACRYSTNFRRRIPLVNTSRLGNGSQLHVKYWVPRKAHHRLQLIGRPSKIEREARQYSRFEEAGLPVADYVFSGVRRLGGPKGIYLTGVLATRTVRGARDLRQLRRDGVAPWAKGRSERTEEVLRGIGALLGRIHHAGLVHGDFMLKNILYCPDRSPLPYCLIDLSSGWPMAPGEDDREGRIRDLVRFVSSLARSDMGLARTRCFLESYTRAWDTTAPLRRATQELFGLCLNASDRKAGEAAKRLGVDPQHPSILYQPGGPSANDRREEDFGLRADLQRGRQHRPLSANPQVGR